ncbi:MAG: DegT/DnrJ/EryC1/StrS family aminotransferase [Microcystis viridis Mv_BB_P_19951000_S69]|jgi:perosamine synthetase|uniref:DegT/DnrJ/EryC1/StrS family aminotransferase n=1 Tax=Microcystis viridis Mv_BB_P_19951000_S68D TaxID=2486270 RepID=A0A552HEL3_MICVR|nr:MAG: DegT/DnrJ/EryC1/StrS family aminotransferase [Microcystis viridis Mv_BB_P_19951000_S68D]TRU71966.1 MAG: DegT/DnrJ/EryC1/StrS family aminotransferase [Microcystis viridis Mv_BB_P_19951000_S68]TRU79073.1 MAG: DegT/DnrJ/EryC1/StrS family aminotransferase [Microcystis viridis Mv_BB_P_19951000_S69]TRU86868.1 MAG: DegT/DnrJ/EryC1/StrS family aminotransferase [Microcystis viridis Mv_BB_P_19951000_S69D]
MRSLLRQYPIKTQHDKMILQIEPWIDESEMEAVKRVINSTYLTEFQITAEFEAGVQQITGAKHVIATSNGTTALYCGLKALNIGHGDEVIVPNLTFVASSNAVIMAGATPVFCEVRPETLCIDTEAAAALVTERTKAIMPVHLYGQSADMMAVQEFAIAYNLKIIEDAAQAIGVKFKGEHVGFQGDVGAISFYGNKTITCGEGGVILTQNDDIALACRRLKNHGRDHRGTFVHEHIGFNFSITELQSAIGVAQLAKLPAIINKKKAIHDIYARELANIPEFQILTVDERCTPVYWFTSFYAENRAELETYLASEGIQTRRFFCPLHQQPCYREMVDRTQTYPISENAYEKGISLPSAYSLTQSDQEFTISKIRQFYQK